jgi:hypothetical protein
MYIKRLLPLISIFLIIVLYAALNNWLISCPECGADGGTSLYQIDQKSANLSNINGTLEREYAKIDLKAASNAAAAATTPPAETPKKNEKEAGSVIPARNTAVNSNGSTTNSNGAKSPSSNTATTVLSEKELLEKDIRGKAATRASLRHYWVFLSGILLFLSLAAITVALYVIHCSYQGTARWLLGGGSLLAGGGVALLIYCIREKYMSIILPMFRESFDKGDVLTAWIHFFNIVGFAATACIVTSSAALYWKVKKKKQQDSANEDFGTERLYAKSILYIGAAMLFVSMLRMDLSFDWHLDYVATHLKDGISRFFSSVLAVQAAFYAIMLGLVYFPFASLPKKGDAEREKAGEPTAGGKIWSLLPEPLPKLLAIISPFLAGPLAELVKFFTAS